MPDENVSMKNLIYFLMILFLTVPAFGKAKLAVVKGKYDEVEVVLKNYNLQYDLIKYSDLNNEGIFNKYDAVYFPCGIVPPIEENIRVVSSKSRIYSVSLKKSYYKLNEKKLAHAIQEYIEDGGAAYFSGYSFKFLNDAYNIFDFFEEFPYMGLPGRIESNLRNDIARFCKKKIRALYMTHSGWISIKSANDAEILVDATYDTPRGIRMGPITILLKRGDGEILYTSYHSTVYSNFRRFNIYRVAGSSLLKKIDDLSYKWEQETTSIIADAIHRGESHREFYIDLKKGENSVYFLAENHPYQVDIYDRSMSPIQSKDTLSKEYIFDIEMENDERCLIKVYPSTNDRFGIFAIVAAEGGRSIPHIMKIIYIFIGIVIIGGLVTIQRLFFFKRYSGR